MPIFLAFAALLASDPPITVTGHSWAPFISPMGEPFRARSATDDTLADWFNQADLNHDGYLTVNEMIADADRFFKKLDTNHDGMIDPDEIANYEWEIAPDIQVMSRTKRAPGDVQRFRKRQETMNVAIAKGSANERPPTTIQHLELVTPSRALQDTACSIFPEPVAAADTNFDRVVTLEEFKAAAIERFQLLDTRHQGTLTLAQLEAMRPALPKDGHYSKVKEKVADKRIGNPLPRGP